MIPLAQIVANGLILGGVYALFALGFGLIYGVSRFFHIAHGLTYAFGAYATFALQKAGLSLAAAGVLGTLGAGALGVLIHWWVYKPIQRGRSGNALVLLVASLGVLVAGQNLIGIFFGVDLKTLQAGEAREGFAILGARVTGVQVVTLFAAVLLSTLVWVWMKFSLLGRTAKAVASDRELAYVSGLRVELVDTAIFFIGSCLAAVGAILVSLDSYMSPQMGFEALLKGMVAAIVGGVGSVLGSLVGGMFVGLVQSTGAFYLPSQLQEVVAFAVMITFLIFRPSGFFGRGR